MRDLIQATRAILEPIALAKEGCLSGEDLRAIYATYAPKGVGFEEAITALECSNYVVLTPMQERDREMTGYQLSVAGEAMADMLMGRNPEQVVRSAAKAILETAHHNGNVALGFGGGHVGPARAAAIFENLLAHEYLAPYSTSYGFTSIAVAVITPRGVTVLDYTSLQL